LKVIFKDCISNPGTTKKFQTRQTDKQGQEIFINWNFIYDVERKNISCIGFINENDDFYKIKILENEYKTLLYSLIHDFKTPVNGLINLLENINLLPVEEKENYLKIAVDNLKAINDRFDYINGQINTIEISDDEQEFNLTELIDKTLEKFKAIIINEKISVSKIYDKKITLKGFYNNYEMIFTNLISNAIKYQKQNTKKSIIAFCKEINDEISFGIIDNGVGFQIDKNNNIIKGNSPKGKDKIGLGLFITLKSVEKIKGEIRFKSKIGEGTNVTVKIKKNNTA
jgi:signal transduction histidine kinase